VHTGLEGVLKMKINNKHHQKKSISGLPLFAMSATAVRWLGPMKGEPI
jgi:hypothetical protein